nr:MAG TPA: hypothetical protein [Caudoviricetes sp.]
MYLWYFYYLFLLQPLLYIWIDFPNTKVENLIKVEVIQMTNVLEYIAGLNITEWYAPLPSHIDVNKVISVTNVNQGNWGEYCNLDIKAKTLRIGAFGNGKTYPLNQLQVIVAYLA